MCSGLDSDLLLCWVPSGGGTSWENLKAFWEDRVFEPNNDQELCRLREERKTFSAEASEEAKADIVCLCNSKKLRVTRERGEDRWGARTRLQRVIGARLLRASHIFNGSNSTCPNWTAHLLPELSCPSPRVLQLKKRTIAHLAGRDLGISTIVLYPLYYLLNPSSSLYCCARPLSFPAWTSAVVLPSCPHSLAPSGACLHSILYLQPE